MKSQSIFALFFVLDVYTFFKVASDGILSVKKVQCDVNDKYVYSNYSCYAKSWSRNVSTGNLAIYMKKSFYEVFVS